MVGRFIQQKNIGARRQGARQRGAAGFAARQSGGRFFTRKAQMTQQIKSPVGIIAGGQARLDIIAGGGEAFERRFLRQIADGGAGLGEAAAAIGIKQTSSDFEQGGFARAVTPHQGQPFAGAHRQLRPLQQLGVAERNVDILEVQKRRHQGETSSSPRRSVRGPKPAMVMIITVMAAPMKSATPKVPPLARKKFIRRPANAALRRLQL